MPTGPHDLEYRHFEGIIEKGSYGAGAVMIWDEGTYTPEVEVRRGVRRMVVERPDAEKAAEEGLREGNLKFILYGKRLHGSFALVRTRGLGGRKEAWLLIKHRDRYCEAGYDASDHDTSAVSKRTLEQIVEGASAD
jgi:bifunctional non-homologous end joining protein LigD